ncbi:MAG: WD40 repeat domain-containing protein [Epsilonproteobacteria bacterium]|nr:WD40 repeat domain-containing protein [Campylobacterota bacterium]
MNKKKRKIYTITQENQPFYNIVKPTDGMQITPDGQYVVTLTRDGSIWFWNCLTGSLERCFELEDENRESYFWRNLFYKKQKMVLTPDGSLVLVFNSILNRLMVVDIEKRTFESFKIKSSSGESCLYAVPSIEAMVIAPDNDSFLIGMSKQLFIFKMRRYRLVNHIEWENKSVHALAYNSKSYYFVAGFEDGDMVLYAQHPLKEMWSIEKAHKGAVTALLFTNNTEKIISAGEDGKVKVWDFHRGFIITELYSSEQKISDLVLSEDEQYLIITLIQKVVVLEINSVEVIRSIEKTSHSPHYPFLTSVLNQKIAIHSTSSGLQLYDMDITHPPKEFTKLLYDNGVVPFYYSSMGCGYGFHYLLLPLDISFDSRYVVVNVSYEKIALWDMRKVELVGLYGEGNGDWGAVTISADNRYIFSATYHEVDEDKKSFIEMYEVESSLLLYRFEIDIKYCNVVLLRVTPNNRYLIAILQGGTLMKWDIESLELVESREVASLEYDIYAPTLSPDGSFLMYALNRSGGWSPKVTSIELVDLETGSRVESINYTINTNSNALLTLEMSRDNRYVTLYANNSKCFCWDREEQEFMPDSKMDTPSELDFTTNMIRSMVAPNQNYRVNIYADERVGLSIVGLPESQELYRLFVAENGNALMVDIEKSEIMVDGEDEVLLRVSDELIKTKLFRRIEFEKYEG